MAPPRKLRSGSNYRDRPSDDRRRPTQPLFFRRPQTASYIGCSSSDEPCAETAGYRLEARSQTRAEGFFHGAWTEEYGPPNLHEKLQGIYRARRKSRGIKSKLEKPAPRQLNRSASK